MAKYVFSKPEKSAVWKAHGHLCFWCGDVLPDLNQVTIDHLFPEDLLRQPERLKKVKNDYQLAESFEINSFENWVAAHFHCNSAKRTTVYNSAPVMIKSVHEASKKAKDAARICRNIYKSLEKSSATAQIQALVEAEKVSKEEVIAMFSDSKEEAVAVSKIADEVFSRLPPGWNIISVDRNLGVAVCNGRSGVTWVGKEEPDSSWRCPTCGSMGPWSGAMCKNCGHFSDD